MKCQLCQETLNTGHPYRAHKMTLEKYMYQFYPKVSLLTGETIEWKNNIENYLLADFNNRNELKQHLKTCPKEENAHYLKGLLLRLKEYKNITYIPTQVELRSRDLFPGIHTFNNYFDYYKICEEIGYKNRGFVNLNKNSILKRERNLKNNPILVDTREILPLNFNNKTIELTALNVGDYQLKNDNYGISIDRKSLNDLTGTFGPKNFDRFRRELIRTKESDAYLIMLVENGFNTVSGFDHSPFYSKHTQMTATFLFHQIRSLLQEFDCWQIAFTKNRTDMVEKIKFIFEMGVKAKTIDWQLAIDLKIVNNNI